MRPGPKPLAHEWRRKSQVNVKQRFSATLLCLMMSVDGNKIFFEGFLRKRKDTMKIRWVSYWFRLQNTTLFFYTKKNGSASHLRGYYYIYTMQSVREVHKTEKKPFLFEIVMKNGKIKMLAAETAALRKEWLAHLWQAMQLSSSGVLDSKRSDLLGFDQRERLDSNFSVCSHAYSVMEEPLSASSEAEEHVGSPLHQDSNAPTCQNLQRPFSMNHEGQFVECQWPIESDSQEGLYDVLPPTKSRCEEPSSEAQDPVYDCPRSYRTPTAHQDTIYDVPSLLLKTRNHTEDERSEGGVHRKT